MKNYEILEHKADLLLRVLGQTKEEVFANMLQGMTASQGPKFKSQKENKKEIKLKSLDLPALLVDFLNEILSLNQIDQRAYYRVSFKELKETELRAEVFGKRVKEFARDIKAATYHSLEFKRSKDNEWQATVLFDL